jgi:hypothetical protein
VEDYDPVNTDTLKSGIQSSMKADRESIIKRLKDLELLLKKRFQNTWTSVRKAFLDLD